MDAEHIKELFSEFGPVSVRRMFSGAGVFVDGLMIALIARDVIYLKTDDETIPDFEREGQSPFSYATKDGTRKLTSYWRMPDRLYDDTEELAAWARRSLAVARRKAERPRAKSASGSRTAEKGIAKAVKPTAAAKAGRKAVRRPAASRRTRPPGRSRT
jgi:DNA transformation protein and related proteins